MIGKVFVRAAFAAASVLPFAANAVPLTALQWSDLTHTHSDDCIHSQSGADLSGTSRASALSDNVQALAANPNGTAAQVVFIDFDAPTPTFDVRLRRLDGTFGTFASPFNGRTAFDTWNYTAQDRAIILERSRQDYRGFNIEFTGERPVSGDFQTSRVNALRISGGLPNITANEVDVNGDGVFTFGVDRYSFSILFGQADRIDFGNRFRTDTARTDASLWTFLEQAGFTTIGGVPVDATTVRGLVLDQASSTSSHEIGHNLGLRHHDAAGPVGSGVNNLGNALTATRFDPTYPGPRAAVDTNLHIMASGASTGESIDPRAGAFFGLREATKLAHNEQAPLDRIEATLDQVGPTNVTFTNLPQPLGDFGDTRGFLDSARRLEQTALDVPNTIEGGLELTDSIVDGGILTASVQGSLSLPTFDGPQRTLDIDFFQVSLQKKSRLAIEVRSVGTLLVQNLAIFDVNFNLLTDYYGTPALNLFEGEGNSSFILDYIVGRTGTYYIGLWSPYGLLDDPLGFNLAPGQFASGNYELYLAQFRVPAPAGLTLFGLGAAGLLAARRRRRG